MKSFTLAAVATCIAVLSIVGAGNAEEAKKKVTKVTCPVAGKEIKVADGKVVSYKKCDVYVCCDNCKAKMEADPDKYSTKANHQLILTRQAKQVKCPLAGKPVDAAQTVKVGGIEVKFCCGNCKGKVAKAEGDEQLALVFSDDAFKKGFKVKEKK
jgi:hypothetical protein